MDAEIEATRLNWRVFSRKTKKLLTRDYGSMKTDELDDMKVYSYEITNHKTLGRYVRVVVNE